MDRSHAAFDLDIETDEVIGEQEQERWLHCRACGERVCPVASATTLVGRHVHRRTNPAGVEFEFAMFSAAPGCAGAGQWETRHTWFAGYRWQVGVCRRCGVHLGWQFATGDHAVYGLIVANMDRRDDDDAA